jgi:hypothetical protein
MDHSLRGYLERRSTEELRAILNYLVYNYKSTPEEAVNMTISILEEREKDMLPDMSQQMQAAWERYLNKRGGS